MKLRAPTSAHRRLELFILTTRLPGFRCVSFIARRGFLEASLLALTGASPAMTLRSLKQEAEAEETPSESLRKNPDS
jgi:hypothetical protein